MQPKKKKASRAPRAKRERTIAAVEAVAAGKPVAAIAAEQGVAARSVSRYLTSPEGAGLLDSVFSAHEARLRELFASSLDAIADCLQPKHPPDIRLQAVGRVTKLLELQRRFAPPAPDSNLVQYEEVAAWVRMVRTR
jgi:AcrR family transcriptional regulator